MHSFCVIIVNYNGAQDTALCVESVLTAAKASKNEVKIIVVNNSADDLNLLPETVHVMCTGHNIGLSGAWYIGFFSQIAQSCEYTIFLNNDAVVPENFFIKLQSGIENWGPNCSFGPRIYDASDRRHIWSRGGKIERFFVRIKHHASTVNNRSLKREDFYTGHISGCCMVIRTEQLNRIGGPDTNYFFRGEEWDLNYRLNQAGIRLVILDEVEVFHRINGSHHRFSPEMLYLAYRAKVLFAKKILPFWYFPLWYIIALMYGSVVAPYKFSRLSDVNISDVRRALVSALLDGLANNKILPIVEEN